MIKEPKPKNDTALFNNSPAWRIARIAIFTALSGVGAFIPIPGPIPSLAFDSFPGFFAAFYFGIFEGALVCGIGHIATAALHGFPYGTLHIAVAIGMALVGAATAAINKLNKRWAVIPAAAIGIAINTLLMLVVVPQYGWGLALIIAPGLFVAALANMLVAAIAYVGLRGKLRL